MWIVFLALLSAHSDCSRADEITLPPIIKEESPIDALTQDPILPAQSGDTTLNASSGAIHHGIAEDIALPVTDSGRPGSLAQFRGMGQSVEDTSVQVFGIPLNPPQGGGLDLSIYPMFFWSEYRFQPGPALGILDPQAVSGTLNLTPWTAHALADPQAVGTSRVTLFYSDARSYQFSAAAHSANVAVLAGESSGAAQGPSGAISGVWQSGSLSGSAHLLITQIDAESPGTVSFPSPDARLLTYRITPVVETEYQWSADASFRNSLFYDNSFLAYDNPDISFSSRDRIWQYGTQNLAVVGNWKLGANARQTTYTQPGFQTPAETIANLQISRIFQQGPVVIEPSVNLIDVNDFGSYPQGSLGVRDEIDGSMAVFARGSFSRRFPSLLDRYSNDPTYIPNPSLVPESDWFGAAGYEWKNRNWQCIGELVLQERQDVQLHTALAGGMFTTSNAGNAHLIDYTQSVSYSAFSWIDLSEELTLSHTAVDLTGTDFPGFPSFIDVVGARLHPVHFSWDPEIRASARFASSAATTTAVRLSGYEYLDLEASASPYKGIRAVVRVDNVFDSPTQETQDAFPLFRAVSVLVVGQLN